MAQIETLRFIITALPTILQNTAVLLLIERVLPISRDFTYKFETFFIYKVCLVLYLYIIQLLKYTIIYFYIIIIVNIVK